MQWVRVAFGFVLQAAGALGAVWGVVTVFDHPLPGALMIAVGFALTIAGTSLRPTRRGDLRDALFRGGGSPSSPTDDLSGYKDYTLGRHQHDD